MISFTPLNEKVEIIREYINQSTISFCDISVGCKFMWRDEFKIDYCIYNDTLILKESCPDYKDAFYFPMGKDILGALSETENYCKEKNIPLKFCCIDNATVCLLVSRYPFTKVYNDRAWSDYIYDAQSFVTYGGKKLSGQRNHFNKFKRLYPDYTFNILKEEDLDRVREFLSEYEREIEISMWTEREEERKVLEFIENSFALKQYAGYIEVGGKIVALSVGEKVGDTLIVHIEKGLKEYSGVYPTMAHEFASAFSDGVKYINREEDCGDMGLRISKLQYHPIEVKEKNIVEVNTLFDKIPLPVSYNYGKITITGIGEEDKESYKNLYLDDENNKFWGYDYKEDLIGEPTADYFYNFSKKLAEKKEELDFAVKVGDKMIGEVCLYNFGVDGSVEIGFRIAKEYQGRGYGKDAVFGIISYAKERGAKIIKARCFKENVRSRRLIEYAGLTCKSESDKQFFFEMQI